MYVSKNGKVWEGSLNLLENIPRNLTNYGTHLGRHGPRDFVLRIQELSQAEYHGISFRSKGGLCLDNEEPVDGVGLPLVSRQDHSSNWKETTYSDGSHH